MPAQEAGDRRRLLLIAGGAAVLVAAVGVLFALVGTSEEPVNVDEARQALAAAGCELQVVPAVPNRPDHSDFPDPSGTSARWNTDPPTSGPHYGQTAVYGAYTAPIELGRLVHNLEHGAIFILYGSNVPQSTLSELRDFYGERPTGTVLAPYPPLENEIALGAWLAEGLPDAASEQGSGVLARCSRFDANAFGAYFDAFQFKGPESGLIGPSQMEPGEQ
jgi:Protein of unknown function (DUF3105)